MLEILEKAMTPDGIKIQLERWVRYGYTVAAYPKAKGSNWLIHRGETIRVSWDSLEKQAREEFEQLKSGEKTLDDFANRFTTAQRILYTGQGGEE